MQTSLFNDPSDQDHFQDHELGNACIREYPSAFGESLANRLLAQLIPAIPWQQDNLRIAGRIVPVPRLQCWMGDRHSHYGYSGIRLVPTPWQEPVISIKQRVEQLAGVAFNSVLLNYYRNGQDSVAWHADDEAELGNDPVIASVSLGAVRPFQLKPKHPGTGPAYRMLLQHGSVIVMGKGLQINWLHQIPKVNNLTAPRLNLTFRQLQ